MTINAEADPTLRPTQFTSGDGAVSTWSFEPTTGLASTIHSTLATGTLQNLDYGYDLLGNLVSKTDHVLLYNTNYNYDSLNRLTENVDSRDTGFTTAYQYDSIGNMTWRSDLGSMSYGKVIPGQPLKGPHQLTGVTIETASPYLAQTTPNALIRSYAHTSFNRISTVTLGSSTTPTLAYAYDDSHQRVSQTLYSSAGSVNSTIYYFHGPGVMLEKQVNADGTYEWHDYISSAAGLVGEYWSSTELGAAAPKTLYFHADAQGTIASITGSASEKDNYEPFGKQQNTNGSRDPTCSLPSGDVQSRGWIGEERLPAGCLVNLNARLYDPLTGHFLGADSVVSQPYSTQGWNRYSYAGNNPMTFTDPTGMCFLGCFWKTGTFREVAGLAVAAALSYWALPALLDGGAPIANLTAGQLAVNAGISGAASGAVSTGTIKGTLISTASALAFSGIGDIEKSAGWAAGNLESVAMHGIAGGLISVAQGGKFQSGFLAAGFAEFAGPPLEIPGSSTGAVIANTAVNAVLGGLGSVMGGGKFENGAITGAFGYLFNSFPHQIINQFDVGNEAHALFEDYAESRDPLNVITESWSDGAGNWFGGRVDIANVASKEIWDIKPDNPIGIFAGRVQVEYYSLISGYSEGEEKFLFPQGGTIGIPGKLAYYTYRYAEDGVVAYTAKVNSPSFVFVPIGSRNKSSAPTLPFLPPIFGIP